MPQHSQTAPKILLTTAEGAAVLGLPLRTFHSLRNEPWMPRPVILGPRLVRWSHSELVEAVGRMPRGAATDEPVQLALARSVRARGRQQPAPFDGVAP